VSSPFAADALVAGAKKMPTAAVSIVPCAFRLSVTVATVFAFDVVPSVRSVGPML
jgi:hypothetical protein